MAQAFVSEGDALTGLDDAFWKQWDKTPRSSQARWDMLAEADRPSYDHAESWIDSAREYERRKTLDEARSATAKQIFSELDKFIIEHDNGNSKNLEDFIFQSLEYNDIDEEEIAKEDYLAFKKKYGIK